MKKIVFSLLFTGLFNLCLVAQEHEKGKYTEPKFKKTKSHSKSYALNSSDKLSLNNQFGEMKFSTWEKNEVKVDVTITGKSDDEGRAQEILNRISISDGKDGNTVYFKTKFADDNDDKRLHKKNKDEPYNEGMEINYMVYLPAQATLEAENQFGNMILPDYRGVVELESKFGKLTAGKLSQSKEITVEFGEGTIESLSGGKLNIKFSNGTVNKASGDLDADLEFSKVKLVVDNSIKSIDIQNSYSDVYLDVDKGISANWDIHTSHGDFDNKTSFSIKDEKEGRDNGYGPRFNKNYKGTSGGGSARIKIHSSFGAITAGHNLQVDMSDRKKDKSHKSSRNSSTRVI